MGRPNKRSELGRDFLDSVQDLFAEATSKGFTSNADFTNITSLVVAFLVACGTTTNARARASCPITLPDGSQPEVDMQLPPGSLKLDEETRAKLRLVDSVAGFVGVLRATMEDQWDSNPRNKRKAADAGKGAEEKRRIKIKIKGPSKFDAQIEAAPVPYFASPSPDVHFASPWPSVQEEVAAPLDSNIHPPVQLPISPRPENEASAASDQRPADDFHRAPWEPRNSPALGVDASADDDTDMLVPGNELENQSPPPPEEGVVKRGLPPDPVETMDMDTHSAAEPDIGAVNAAAADLSMLVGEVAMTTPDEWAIYQPKLITSLCLLNQAQLAPRISLDPIAVTSPTSRFLYAMSYLGDDFPFINIPEWTPYRQELERRCGSSEFAALDFRQRLMEMVDVCYLPEELNAMATGDWDALITVARLCAVLAAATGAEDEELGAGAESFWLRSKMRDIAWLKKVFLTKKCVVGIDALSMDD